jgi:hypothetical protein
VFNSKPRLSLGGRRGSFFANCAAYGKYCGAALANRPFFQHLSFQMTDHSMTKGSRLAPPPQPAGLLRADDGGFFILTSVF